MSIKVIADSCCDLPDFYENEWGVNLIPLKITVDGTTYTDDGSIDTHDLIRAMKASSSSPSTACPSPSDYADAMSGDDDVFVVTLSSQLSGSYQSAKAGAELKRGTGRVHVLDSQSASAGQVLLVHNLLRLIKEGLGFSEIAIRAEKLAAEMKTFFVLQSLDNLIKAGRISRLVGQLASILHMRPIMGEDGAGNILLLEKARGTQNAMKRLGELVIETAEKAKAILPARDTLVIAHCNCLERAQELKKQVLHGSSVIRNVLIVATGGLSTVYANDGGIVVGY